MNSYSKLNKILILIYPIFQSSINTYYNGIS